MKLVWMVMPASGGCTGIDFTQRRDDDSQVASLSLKFTDTELCAFMQALMGKLIAHDPDLAHRFLVAAARGLDDYETHRGRP